MLALLLLATAAQGVSPQALIRALNDSDPVYRQHQQLVAEYHRAVSAGAEPPPLVLFSYAPDDDADLFDLASRLMVPVSSIATLNRLDSPRLGRGPTRGAGPLDGTAPDGTPHRNTILIPSQPGLFAWPEPRSALERAVADRFRHGAIGTPIRVPREEASIAGVFVPGVDFVAEERDIFGRERFVNPLPHGRMTSPFGFRRHPVGGAESFHNGVDLAAEFGDAVLVIADGVVETIERDSWLGLSVTVRHRRGYSSAYAHLQETTVRVGQAVAGGDTIGYVGSTGLSTGSHLHFEIRNENRVKDPETYLSWD